MHTTCAIYCVTFAIYSRSVCLLIIAQVPFGNERLCFWYNVKPVGAGRHLFRLDLDSTSDFILGFWITHMCIWADVFETCYNQWTLFAEGMDVNIVYINYQIAPYGQMCLHYMFVYIFVQLKHHHSSIIVACSHPFSSIDCALACLV